MVLHLHFKVRIEIRKQLEKYRLSDLLHCETVVLKFSIYTKLVSNKAVQTG
mgnify:CR=1 FL=1